MDEKSAKNGNEYQRPSNEEKLKELTDKLQDGVKAVRDSAEYKKLLATMAKFPHYSLNNCMLIAMQKPDATLCQGYNAWKKMGRYVRKGEKGIKVIAPSPYTIQKEVDVLDSKGRPVLDQDGEPVKQTKELNLMGFKAETTFDISQTEGKELPRVGVDELKGSIDKYEVLMGVLKDISPVPIGFEDIKSGAKGYYHTEDKRIAVQQGMSELQTLKTCIHEITHAMLHGDNAADISKNRKELEAEGTASIVLSFMGYNTDDYSYPYLCGYTSDADMKELKASLGTIRQTSSRIIKKIEDKLGEIYKERNPEIVADNEPVKNDAKESVRVGDDSPFRDTAGCTVIGADGKATKAESVVAERKILGTVRILPDGWGGMKQSLLDNLSIRKNQIKNDTAAKVVKKDREVC
ncbi:ArdC-like ssDNA-binding domain-containing protein [Butyrivibrio sp. WCD3002]|uniref:ArdC-like ssDNA-binding domain-containing protein n=1 Tax=Butyrivibrio sp. WCD3002 TaxID=1280676 RepID=UPI0003FDECE8|nr:ArdC-like ssDNA-binding domain-containing protein [Butyrivibrio sp. WCD3002]